MLFICMEDKKSKNCKICNICNLEKELQMFYINKGMKDGYQNRCIECTKIKTKIRLKQILSTPEGVESEKKRHREKYHRLEYKGKNYPTTERKREIIKKHHQKYPEKALASKYTEIFLTKTPGFNLHHWSYNQEDWLDIIELSIKEHGFIHRFIKYDQERMMYRDLDGILLDTKERHMKYFENCKIKYKDEL